MADPPRAALLEGQEVRSGSSHRWRGQHPGSSTGRWHLGAFFSLRERPARTAAGALPLLAGSPAVLSPQPPLAEGRERAVADVERDSPLELKRSLSAPEDEAGPHLDHGRDL